MGAAFEGIHRKHRVIPGLGIRDTAWYSITDDEWPRVRNVLESRLASRLTGSAERC
jgi:N-acetyltransferase